MNVEQLRTLLNGFPGSLEVMVAADEEWNKVVKLYSLDETYMCKGEPVNTDDVRAGEYEGEVLSKALILWG